MNQAQQIVANAGVDAIAAMTLAERAGATFDQDWTAGTSTATFSDGSRLVFDGQHYDLAK